MKSNLDKYFKTNKELEKSGVWFEIEDGVAFLITPFNQANPRFKAAMAQLYKPYARQIEAGLLPTERVTEISIKLFVKVSLMDWKGIVIDDKDTPYSPEIAIEFFKSLPDLFSTLWEHAQNSANYREDLGNS